MKTSKFQKLLDALRQVFQRRSNISTHIPPATGLKKTSESSAPHASPGRDARLKLKDDPQTEPTHRQHPSDRFSSESKAYRNFR
ncbi:MAG: hypothetical protein HUU32_21880 [Calditrichaceae bacterium]|nr:hypothetical protein [Calditrichaceae bacterium]